jgi:hypothetical protein
MIGFPHSFRLSWSKQPKEANVYEPEGLRITFWEMQKNEIKTKNF